MTGARLHAPLLAAAFGLAWAASLSVDRLAQGGLAPLAGATVLAAVVGAPVASLEWRTPLDHSQRLDRAARTLGNLWSLLLLAALAAPVVAAHGLVGAAVATVAWFLLAARAPATWIAPILVLAALAVAVGEAGACTRVGSPWTLLDPQWGTPSTWLPESVVGGLLMAGAGMGQWRQGPLPPPGSRSLPWLTAGVVLAVALCVSVVLGARFEASAGQGAAVHGWPLLWLAGVAAVLGRWSTRRDLALHAAGGLVATLWFAWPAAGALPVWWASLLPLGPALFALHLGLRTAGGARALAFACALLLLGAATLGWPGLPRAPLDAAALAATVVVAVWIVGTRALYEEAP